GVASESSRRHRVAWLTLVGSVLGLWLWLSVLAGHLVGVPHLTTSERQLLPLVAILVLVAAVMVLPFLATGRSPHVRYRAEEIDVTLDDVRGLPVVVEEAVRTLNLFLAHATFRAEMGGTPRKGILFEGPPGTGKTYMAKAMAKEAGVPFLFVSASAFQSMFYGQTNRKIRAYFRALRRYARREGGAIGFIEEIDAIGTARSGLGSGRTEGIAGIVNELLIQLQSFDQPPAGTKMQGMLVDLLNSWLPARRHVRKPVAAKANILVIGATNRAGDLDPALLRPGRFDRTIYFDLPSRSGRREIIDYYLTKKAHLPELDEAERRDTLAALTSGYTPVMLEHLFDEALVWALRRGGDRLSWDDLQQAKMTTEIGMGQPVEYTEAERRTIATHESGHATVAWLVGKSRKLEVLSIVKRRQALGLLAHSETEERFTQTRSELEALIEIAMGGLAAEELFFGETSSGVAGDLQTATVAACQMIGAFGMGHSLVSLMAVDAPTAGNVVAKVLSSDQERQQVDEMLDQARNRVRKMIDEHRNVVEALRDALLERDELVGQEILDVITGAATPLDVPTP
ncbi:MAG TPA: AAA family ATPase, partial [Acidimicrobiales bacterium]|nr:AAA family ATPase [Acidimicrobiales bacterium]